EVPRLTLGRCIRAGLRGARRMTVEAPAELVEFVLEETGHPIDVWAVAATLESGGVRDADARARGARDVFELAEAVLAACRTRPLLAPESTAVPRIELRRFVRLYLRGGFFFIPFLMQLVALVALGYGLWASVDFSLRQASIVGCALIFSFVVTGPVV